MIAENAIKSTSRRPQLTSAVSPIDYPESDGQPLGETGLHLRLISLLLDVLGHHLAGRQFYCGSNQFFCYRQDDATANIAPEFYVLADTPSEPPLEVYKFWEHNNRPPVFVLEVASPRMVKEDQTRKRSLYRRLGVPEYFLFDPTGQLLSPTLQGYRLTGRRYAAIAATTEGGLLSEQLGVRFQARPDGGLTLWNAVTGQRLLTGWEAEQLAAARIAELQAELARLRGGGSESANG